MWTSFMDGLEEAGAQLYADHFVSNMRKHDGLILPKANEYDGCFLELLPYYRGGNIFRMGIC